MLLDESKRNEMSECQELCWVREHSTIITEISFVN